jgi:hypothetical protein
MIRGQKMDYNPNYFHLMLDYKNMIFLIIRDFDHKAVDVLNGKFCGYGGAE